MKDNKKFQKNNSDKDVVLCAVRSYDFDCLEPFLTSLYNTGYQGEVCFFVDDVSSSTIQRLKDRGVKVIPFSSKQLKIPFRNKKIYWYKLIPRIINYFRSRQISKEDPNRIENDAIYAAKYLPITHSRFALFHNYISKNKNKYDRVIISDVRDVVFQTKPFDFDMPDKVCFFLESKNQKIKDCRFNSEWIKTGFGNEALEKHGDKLITCAGVTLGPTNRMLAYLRIMTQYLTVPDMCYKDGGSGLDQAVHNYIIYENIVPNFRLFENDEGAVMTMGYMTEQEMIRNSDGLHINRNGDVINTLHQFDRHPNLTKEVLDKLDLDESVVYPRVSKWSFF